jgi:biotin transport system permease protein
MSPVARAAVKLALLLVAGVAAFQVQRAWVLGAALALVGALAVVGRVRPAGLARQVLVASPFVLAVVIAHGLVTTWGQGGVVGLRLLVLITAAAVVTLTTRVTEILSVLEGLFRPLRIVGVDPTRIGLVFAMTIRFVPLLADRLAEIRQAQRARGRERPGVTLLAPLLISTLRLADDVGDALDARGLGDGGDRRG